jgi:hypothetical protein
MSYSVWPLYFTPYNFPHHVRRKLGVTTLLGVIAGKKDEKAKLDLQPFLQLIVDELNYMYVFGEEVYDAHKDEFFTLRVKLIQVISDYRGLQKITNLKLSPALHACLVCWLKGFKLVNSGKTVYPGNWTFLPEEHWLRCECYRNNIDPAVGQLPVDQKAPPERSTSALHSAANHPSEDPEYPADLDGSGSGEGRRGEEAARGQPGGASARNVSRGARGQGGRAGAGIEEMGSQ